MPMQKPKWGPQKSRHLGKSAKLPHTASTGSNETVNDKVRNKDDDDAGKHVTFNEQRRDLKLEENLPSPELLTYLPQKQQSWIAPYQMDEYSNYNPKFGDLQQWKVYTKSGDHNRVVSKDLWFLKDANNHKQRRRVFVEGKVDRVWKINADDETFEAKMYFFMSWMITKEEYSKSIVKKDRQKERWKNPRDEVWHPELHIPNLIDGKIKFVEDAGDKFKVISYKNFAGFDPKADSRTGFQIQNAKFIRCKVEISGVFHADFDLKAFPFDVQELEIPIMERSGRGTFFPALRKREDFMSVDRVCYEVKEWHLELTMFEFVDTNPNYDSSSFGENLSQFIVDFKYQRNYWKYIARYIFVTMTITALSLLAFTFDYAANADRCAYVVALVLTIAFMDYQRPNTDEHTILDKYVTTSHLFLSMITVITGVSPKIMPAPAIMFDRIMMCVSMGIFALYHCIFAVVAYFKHSQEVKKMYRTYDKEIEKMVEEENVRVNKMQANYTEPIVDSTHSLAFVATKKIQ